ncbi:hypothetical protein GLW08_01030 [Pontibacillus yanchengensis]|uniref:Uncharacterized protein n=2 Tax=Pontibacillus yanchengensis TaxID=462910 RepID=A0ACC7VB30_9BACI|nr:hypothetical protein [Pontibacillus yanchengensis]MYL33238.1 hypothetical protein [Pontibacillus yanchengensis]MYL51912.1 hypothetical protein [Pontibacillus yanchengensis]
MNVESKYIIRWGIPGWLIILYYILLDAFSKRVFFSDNLPPVEIIVALLTAISFGVIVGYLLHQAYFAMEWLFGRGPLEVSHEIKQVLENAGLSYEEESKPERQYFYFEYLWQKSLANISSPHKMEYLSARYQHLLTRTQELGVLRASLIICLLITGYFIFFENILFLGVGLLIILGTLFLFVHRAQRYFTRNTHYFIAYNLRDLLQEKENK